MHMCMCKVRSYRAHLTEANQQIYEKESSIHIPREPGSS